MANGYDTVVGRARAWIEHAAYANRVRVASPYVRPGLDSNTVIARLNNPDGHGTRFTAFVRGDEGTYRRALRRDRSLFVDIVYSRSSERRILHNGKGYRGTGGKVEEVSGPRYLAMVYQYIRGQ